jgi:hypothetical protein
MTVTQPKMIVAAALMLLSAVPALAQEAANPLATAKHENGLIVEILEVKADSNELLTIRWRYRNATNKNIELFAATPPAPWARNAPRNIPYHFYPAIYYVEGKFQSDKALKHYIVIEQGTKRRYAKAVGVAPVRLRPNQQFELWAKFSLPAAGGTTISLVLPGTPVIENLPLPGAEREKRQD